MSRHQLAQLNIAQLLAPIDSPQLADFVGNLDRVNALAESAEGFMWRLVGEGNDATSLRPLGDDVIVNMSVWRDAAALRDFVYRSAHVEILKRKREWFARMAKAYQCLWWVPEGHRPTVSEALSKLEHLRTHGATAEAFTFARLFPPPGSPEESPLAFGDTCPA